MATSRLSGPIVEGRARRRRRWVLTAIIVVMVMVAAGIAPVMWVATQMPRVDVTGLASASAPLHVLVVGSDSREGLTAEERRELSTGHAEGARADTMFIMTIEGARVALLALPRDLWVQRCDGSTSRINSAISIADGPGCLVRTVAAVTGLPVHHYLEVTFSGFRDVVDALDGVPLCLDQAIADRDAGIDLAAGCQRLGGRDALGYVRVRKIDDDFQRILRQQQFVQALASEMLIQASLARPVRSVTIAGEVASAVTADDQLGPVAMLRIAWAMRSVARGDLLGNTLPVTPRITSQGAYVLDLIDHEAAPLLAAHRNGTIFDQEPQ